MANVVPWIVGPLLVALVPPLVLLICLWAGTRRLLSKQADCYASEDEELKRRVQAAWRLRARVTFANVSLGWVLICWGMTPTIIHDLGAWQLFSPTFGNPNQTFFAMSIPPGLCFILLGVYPTDTKIVGLLSLFLPTIASFFVAVEGAFHVHRLAPRFDERCADQPWEPGYCAASLAEIVQASAVLTWGTPVVLILIRLAWRRRRVAAPALLAKLWMWLAIVLVMSGLQTLIYVSCRYFLGIRHWYNAVSVQSDLMLGLVFLLTGILVGSSKRRSCMSGVCPRLFALFYRPTYHDRNAVVAAGLALYGRRGVDPQFTTTPSGSENAPSSPSCSVAVANDTAAIVMAEAAELELGTTSAVVAPSEQL